MFKSFKATTAIGAFLIFKHGTADDTAALATAATDKLVATSDGLAKDIGEMVDGDLGFEPKVKLGVAVNRGDALTSDAQGRAIAAAPAAGANVRIIGFASQTGVLDDVIRYLRAPGVVQG